MFQVWGDPAAAGHRRPLHDFLPHMPAAEAKLVTVLTQTDQAVSVSILLRPLVERTIGADPES